MRRNSRHRSASVRHAPAESTRSGRSAAAPGHCRLLGPAPLGYGPSSFSNPERLEPPLKETAMNRLRPRNLVPTRLALALSGLGAAMSALPGRALASELDLKIPAIDTHYA